MPTRGLPRAVSVKTLLAALVAVQTLLLAGFVAMGAFGDLAEERARAADDAAAAAGDAAVLIAEAVDEAKAALAAEAVLPGYAETFTAPEACSLTAGGSGVFTSGSFQIVRPDGTVACSSLRPGGVAGAGYANQAWWTALGGSTEPVISGPLLDPVTKKRALIVAAPIAEPGGALVLSLDLASLAAGLERQFGTDAAAPSFVVLTGDRSSEVTRSRGAIDDGGRISSEIRIDGLGWYVTAGISEAAALADAYRELVTRIALGLASVAVVLLVAWAINRRIVRPVLTLTDAVDAASEGRMARSVPENGPAELARLGRRFNNMLRVRAKAERSLVHSLEAERRASDRLKELDGMKSAFILAISHELRTPLTAVSGFAAMLQDAGLSNADKRECIRRIGSASERLERLLLDLLDVERLARGVIEAHRQPTDLRELVRGLLSTISGAARVDVKIKAGLEANIDAALVERIVENLVRNAIKHTPTGTRVCVQASRRKGVLNLRVDDTGPGVPDAMKEAIFEPFAQADRPEHAPGTGVGLTLVSQFARVHGGRAWVEDRRGGGASFRVTLGVNDSPADPAAEAA